nr:pinoresinol reductase 1 [Quercus suber]
MSPIKKVVLAGAGGDLGSQILKALLEANFVVTVLARSESSHEFPPAVRVAKVDYSDTESLENALEGQDAVISAVGYAAFSGQEALIDAAIATGVQRIIPSEYGTDPDVPTVRALPVFAGKVLIEQHVRSKTQGTSTSFTLVCNNSFFDWDLDHGFGVDIRGRKIEIFDGGDTVHTVAPLEFVARGVVSVLLHPVETMNRIVRLHGAAMTQNKLLERIQRFVGRDGWKISHVSTEDREKQGEQILRDEPSNWMGWAIPFLQVAVFGERFRGNFADNNDNELLGLKGMTDADIEEIVRRHV